MRWAARGAGWLLRQVSFGKQSGLSHFHPEATSKSRSHLLQLNSAASACRFKPSKFELFPSLWSQSSSQPQPQPQQVPFLFRRSLFTAPSKLASDVSSSPTATPVRSPLIPTAIPDKDKSKAEKPVVGKAKLVRIKQSPKKVDLVAALVRGMRVEDAINQMAVSTKRAAKTVAALVHAAASNGVNNHGMTKGKLVVAEAFVSKDKFLKRNFPHARGKSGIRERPRCILTVIVKEMSGKQERELERSRTAHWSRKQVTRLRPHIIREVGFKKAPTIPTVEGEIVN